MIKVFTTTTCPSCAMVKKYLDMKKKAYEVINLDEEPERRQEAIALSGAMTVPVIVSGEEVVVGYNPARLAIL